VWPSIQPVSNPVNHLRLCNYNWLVFVENVDDWCPFMLITYDKALFHTKYHFHRNTCMHNACYVYTHNAEWSKKSEAEMDIRLLNSEA
jgi:hypothetical protein